MKDKLRELAERWFKETNTPCIDPLHNSADRSKRRCATELLALIDAEGDGGAVAWVADLAPGVERPKNFVGIFTPSKGYADHLATYPDYVVTPLYTHPARSGVVSDEDVEAAVDAYDAAYSDMDRGHENKMTAMRAALTHFAAIAQEKQS